MAVCLAAVGLQAALLLLLRWALCLLLLGATAPLAALLPPRWPGRSPRARELLPGASWMALLALACRAFQDRVRGPLPLELAVVRAQCVATWLSWAAATTACR
jgi:hypothetical protein